MDQFRAGASYYRLFATLRRVLGPFTRRLFAAESWTKAPLRSSDPLTVVNTSTLSRYAATHSPQSDDMARGAVGPEASEASEGQSLQGLDALPP